LNSKATAIDKTIEILKRLAEEPFTMSVIELSNELNMNRSTVHRILGTLKKEMLVLQNPFSKMYTIGPGSYHIGMAYLVNQGNTEQIRYILNEVAKDTKQSIGYASLIGEEVFNIFEVESYQPIKIGYRPGSYYPIHCGSYGKTIMAYFEPIERLEEIVYSANLFKKTPKTITDPKELLEEYKKIREQGYAISDEENLNGAIGVGAPIRNSNGRVIACIAAAAIKSNITKEEFELIKGKVIEGAQKISTLML